MARDTVQQLTQIGVEAEKGAGGTAGIILPGTSFEADLRPEVSTFRPVGQKYVTVAALRREWLEASIRGIPCYDDLAYLLASLMCDPISEQVDTSAAYTHTYALNRSAPDDVLTFAVEQGDPSTYAGEVIAHGWEYGLVTELQLEISRTADPSVTGRMIGRNYKTLETTMTLGAALSEVPVNPPDVSLYMDDDLVNIGTTLLTSTSRVRWRLANRFNARWALNAAQPSWSREVETQPELTFSLLMEADDTGMIPLDHVRAGSTLFFRLKAESSVEADTGVPYALQLDLAAKVTDMSAFQDDEGVYAVEWTFTGTPELSHPETGETPCIAMITSALTDIA